MFFYAQSTSTVIPGKLHVSKGFVAQGMTARLQKRTMPGALKVKNL